MAYAYYQQTHPTWGTSQFQFGPPPAPAFQPDSAWSGWDYYRAHAVNPSRSLFYSILDRIRGYDGSRYVSTHEARSIHLRLYGGFLNLDRVMPGEIGSAAAYEAYRTWKHHGSLLQPLGGQAEREREALTGLALAETSHLWQYSGRSMDTYGLQDALETAALTAARLYDKKVDKVTHDVAPIYARDYGYTRHRRHSSIPSVVRAGSASPFIGGGAVPLGPASVGGTPMSGYSTLPRSSPYAAGVALPAVQPQIGGTYGTTLQPTAIPGATVMPQPQVQYAGSYPQAGGGYNYGYGQQQQPIVIQQAQPYGGNGYAGEGGYGGYDGGGRYGGYSSGGGYGGYSGNYGNTSRPIVIDASGRSSSRRHSHHHRSRSMEPVGRSYSRHGYHRHGHYL